MLGHRIEDKHLCSVGKHDYLYSLISDIHVDLPHKTSENLEQGKYSDCHFLSNNDLYTRQYTNYAHSIGRSVQLKANSSHMNHILLTPQPEAARTVQVKLSTQLCHYTQVRY